MTFLSLPSKTSCISTKLKETSIYSSQQLLNPVSYQKLSIQANPKPIIIIVKFPHVYLPRKYQQQGIEPRIITSETLIATHFSTAPVNQNIQQKYYLQGFEPRTIVYKKFLGVLDYYSFNHSHKKSAFVYLNLNPCIEIQRPVYSSICRSILRG